MSVDPSVIAAMQAAADAEPDNAALRAHLAALRLRSGDHEGALSDARAVLRRAPRATGALAIARDAARLAGDEAQAEGFGRALAALQGHAPAELPPPGAPVPELGPSPPPPGVGSQTGEREPGGELDDDALARSLRLAVTRERVTLADVAGMAGVRERLESTFLGPLRTPGLRDSHGTSLRGGLLLYGPPGCGKTFLARALAGELGAELLAAGLGDVPAAWTGRSERWLAAIFQAARRRVPSVVFLHDLDAAGRADVEHLLAELDGARAGNDGVFVLAATNTLWDVDPALLRPGRLERTLLVLPPDRAARAGILRRSLRDRRTARIDPGKLAARTEGFSGADLVQLVEAAAAQARAEPADAGGPRPITQRDLERARREISPSTRPWLATAHSYAKFADADGAYRDLLAHMRENRLL